MCYEKEMNRWMSRFVWHHSSSLYDALWMGAVCEATACKTSVLMFQTEGPDHPWDELFIQGLGGGGGKTLLIYTLSLPANPK